MIKGESHVFGKSGKSARKRLTHIPGQVILRVRRDVVSQPALGLKFTSTHAKSLPEAVSGPLEYLRNNAGLETVRPLFSRRAQELERRALPAKDRARLAVFSSVVDSSSEELGGINMVTLDPKKVTPKLMRHLRDSKAVEFCEPMPARWLQATKVDPLKNLQWGLRATRWFDAEREPADDIVVGVVDSGIDAGHPDLEDALARYEHPGSGKRDVIGHGTHVSGIIAATVNNGVGISGVANCRIAMWKVFDDTPAEDGEFYVDGERYFHALGAARDAGLRVLNLSLGGTESSQAEQTVFRSLETAGVVVVAAMGNEYQEGNPTEYPGAYETVLAVGAVAENLRRSSFSNTGDHIALCAPGSNILSTLPLARSDAREETEYASWSGTSMATPHVAGAAALLAAKNPKWSAQRIKKHLVAHARKLPAMKKKWSSAYGSGLLDLAAALR